MIPLADLLQDPRRALDIPREAVPGLLAQTAALQAALAARLAAPEAGDAPEAKSGGEGAAAGDRWLSVEDADQISGLGKGWLYDHWKQIPGTKKFSPKRLRFQESAFRRWLARRP